MSKLFTTTEDNYIRENYLKLPVKRMAHLMGRSGFGVFNRLRLLGLEIPADIVEARKNASRFSSDYTPFNKGKKQHEFMSADAIERTKKTRFKKGNVPHNALFDGVISERCYGSDVKYLFIRIESKKWELLHRHVWEKTNGPIPVGFNIVFKDKNQLNCDISNLECISDADLILRNQIHQYPADLQEVIRLKNKLNRKIKKTK